MRRPIGLGPGATAGGPLHQTTGLRVGGLVFPHHNLALPWSPRCPNFTLHKTALQGLRSGSQSRTQSTTRRDGNLIHGFGCAADTTHRPGIFSSQHEKFTLHRPPANTSPTFLTI